MRKSWMITALWLGLSAVAHSQTTSSPALGTSGSWLVLPSSVRAEGLAEAYVGVADDIGSMNINPAGLGQLQDSQISLMHNGWVQGMIEEQARTSFQFSGGVAAVGLGYLNGGTIDRVVIVGGSPVVQGTFQPTALRLDLGYGIEMVKDWYFGASATLEEDSMDSDTQWGGMGNLGVLGKWGKGFRSGLALVNIGGTAGYGTPVQWRLGASYDTPVDDNIGHLLVTAQGGTLFVDPGIGNLSFGVEYLYHDTVAVRIGHQFGAYGGLTGLTGFSIGAGVKIEKWELDYALATRGDLGTSNMISFNYNFGKEEFGTPKPSATSTHTPTETLKPFATATWTSTFTPTPTSTVPLKPTAISTVIKRATATPTWTATFIPTSTPTTPVAKISQLIVKPTLQPTMTATWTATKPVATSTWTWTFTFTPTPAVKTPTAIQPSSDDWWEKPFDALASFEKLKTQMVPELIGKGQMPTLDKNASAFFRAAQKDGASEKTLLSLKSGYYATVASEYFNRKQIEDATIYLNTALSLESNNPSALALKAKMDQASAKPTASVPTNVPTAIAVPIQVTAGTWWEQPIDALASFEKLKTQLVPDMVGKGQMDVLDKDASAFFAAAKKDGATEQSLASLKSGYYTAVASALFDQGKTADAASSLKAALSIQPLNSGALALKAKMEKTSVTVKKPKPTEISPDGWWAKPFDALDAFEKLKTKMVPDLMAQKQMPLLGKCATAFFDAAKKDGATGQALSTFKSGYYAAIASELLGQNKAKDAAYYLKLALSIQSDNADALAVKAKMDKIAQ